jgi:hypothetical protein
MKQQFSTTFELTNEIRWSHVGTQFCVFLWKSKLQRNDEINEQFCLVRNMLHGTCETLYNSSERQDMTNGIFYSNWKKFFKLFPKTSQNIWHKHLQFADVTGCVNAIKFNLQEYSWYTKPQLYLKLCEQLLSLPIYNPRKNSPLPIRYEAGWAEKSIISCADNTWKWPRQDSRGERKLLHTNYIQTPDTYPLLIWPAKQKYKLKSALLWVVKQHIVVNSYRHFDNTSLPSSWVKKSKKSRYVVLKRQ